MVTIDGSLGEGGGQVLRTSLALAMTTGRPCRVTNIRAGRAKPGLLRQHLTALKAAAAVSGATLEGADLRSTEVTFAPARIAPGEYRFSVGSAGSATLVLQTVLPPLLTASASSTLTIEGGTHNPWAPPFDFLARAFAPVVRRLGPRVQVDLNRPGFFPAGGGSITVRIDPVPTLAALDLLERGQARQRSIRAVLSGLPRHIADRELSRAVEGLNWDAACGSVEMCREVLGPGNVVIAEIVSDHITEVFTAFGETGTRAEAVADALVRDVRRYLAADAPVGEYLADQLLVILAVGSGGTFRTLTPSRHTTTNIDVIERFLGRHIEVSKDARDGARITVHS